jgi:hypothetical protein
MFNLDRTPILELYYESRKREHTNSVVYYESIKRELQRRLIYEYRCDERLKTENEESTRLVDTGLKRGFCCCLLLFSDDFNTTE